MTDGLATERLERSAEVLKNSGHMDNQTQEAFDYAIKAIKERQEIKQRSILMINKGELPLIGSDDIGLQPLNESGKKECYSTLDISILNRMSGLLIFESVMLTLLVIVFVLALVR